MGQLAGIEFGNNTGRYRSIFPLAEAIEDFLLIEEEEEEEEGLAEQPQL
jgi:hypothetical protein